MQNTTKKLTVRAELRATAFRSDIANQLMRLAREARSGDLDLFVAAKNALYAAIGRALHDELSTLDAAGPRAGRIKRLLSARDRELDMDFILDVATRAYCADIPQNLDADPVSDDFEVQHAVVAERGPAPFDERRAEAAAAINPILKASAMKDLIHAVMKEMKTDPFAVGALRDVDSPFETLRKSGDIPAGATYSEIAELVADEFRNRLAEIDHPDYGWQLSFEVEGHVMDLQIYLTHKRGFVRNVDSYTGLPDFEHESQALWDGLGMWHYDKHNACGNSNVMSTEVRFWFANLDEQFS